MKKLLLTLTSLFFLFSFVQAQKSWRVNNIPGIDSDFTTINAAVSAATAGDTIYVESSPNNYSGTVTITKKLFIFGTGYFLTDSINPKTQWNRDEAKVSSTINLNSGSTGSVLSGLSASNIYINDSSVTIERCYISTLYLANAANSFANNSTIKQNYIIGNIVSNTNTGTAKDILIHNNMIRSTIDFSGNLINTTAYFINNDFIYHNGFSLTNSVFQNNIFFYPSFGTYLGSNAFYNNISNNNVIPQINGNKGGVNLNDVYVNFNGGNYAPSAGFSFDGKYVLKPGSVAANAGDINGTTVDIGAFGGSAPYILSGMPPIPSIYKLSVPIQINAGVPTMTISVSAAAH